MVRRLVLSVLGRRTNRVPLLLLLSCQVFALWHIFFSSKSKKKLVFQLPDELLPVHHEADSILYHNHPVSKYRPPSNQFNLKPRATFNRPDIAIITATNNPREILLETAQSVLGQSLQNLLWVIVDDHTTEKDSLDLLKQVSRDPRVHLIKNNGKNGLASSRNVALDYILTELAFTPPYLASLDDDDIYEFTALEKTTWMLESNLEWDIGGFYVVRFGALNETVTMGLHSGAANYHHGNFVPNAAIFRTSAVLGSACRYDDINFPKGGEDWDFWMCLAEKGHWGGTLPEFLYWYRGNPSTFRSSRWGNMFSSGEGIVSLKSRIHSKHSTLAISGAFPDIPPRHSVQLENIHWGIPFQSNLAQVEKSIMFIVPWLYVGGADMGALHMVQIFAEAGYRVTVVCTLYKVPQGIELRPLVAQWTHDIHILPSFLRAVDIPRYLKHLAISRDVKQIVFSNSQLIYEMLPALVEQLPKVKFVDYLHNEAYDGWKSAGYPQYSIISRRYIARTLTCSNYLRDWLIERGYARDRIGVVRLGIAVRDYIPNEESTKQIAKRNLLGVGPEVKVITVVGRIDHQKRPLLIPGIAETLRRDGHQHFLIVMLGDGDLMEQLKEQVRTARVETLVRIIGTTMRPQDYLAATDIFLLPSISEGISIAVAEAMAVGLPVVTSRAGALPEQLGEGLNAIPGSRASSEFLGGILVNHTLVDEVDQSLYATQISKLLRDPKLRAKLGERGRQLVVDGFDWRITLSQMFKEISIARNLHKPKSFSLSNHDTPPQPAVHLAIQNLLLEHHPEMDFADSQIALQAPARIGLGKVLQNRCGESNMAMTEWINHIVDPKPCDPNFYIDAKALSRSASYQCSAWCIFDLHLKTYDGWSYNGECFTKLSESTWCKEFWSARPKIMINIDSNFR